MTVGHRPVRCQHLDRCFREGGDAYRKGAETAEASEMPGALLFIEDQCAEKDCANDGKDRQKDDDPHLDFGEQEALHMFSYPFVEMRLTYQGLVFLANLEDDHAGQWAENGQYVAEMKQFSMFV